jgi:hypothetical protein
LVAAGGGNVADGTWTIEIQQPKAPETLEVAFEDLTPVARRAVRHKLETNWSMEFEGRGFAIDGRMEGDEGAARCQVKVDGKVVETVTLDGDYHNRRTPLFWYYDLEPGPHVLEIVRQRGNGFPRLDQIIIYQ